MKGRNWLFQQQQITRTTLGNPSLGGESIGEQNGQKAQKYFR